MISIYKNCACQNSRKKSLMGAFRIKLKHYPQRPDLHCTVTKYLIFVTKNDDNCSRQYVKLFHFKSWFLNFTLCRNDPGFCDVAPAHRDLQLVCFRHDIPAIPHNYQGRIDFNTVVALHFSGFALFLFWREWIRKSCPWSQDFPILSLQRIVH